MSGSSSEYDPNATGFSYRCDQCGAQMQFDPARGMLACAMCGATKAAPQASAVGGAAAGAEVGQVQEIRLDQGLIMSKSKGLGTETVSARCDECGAVVQFTPGVTATRCTFCDSPKVLAQQSQGTSLTPESLIPFGLDAKAAQAAFGKWLKGLWFRPGDLTSESKIKELKGVYVPYWTFDARAHSNWNADAGYYYYVEEEYWATENGKKVRRTKRVKHTRWEPAWGQRSDFFDDKLICASKGLPANLVKQVSNFSTKELVPYQPSFLAGWSAEAYAIDLELAWKTAQAEMFSEQTDRCRKDVPGDTQRNLRVNTRLSEQTFKHVLLPVWIAAFRYNDKPYRFLVNGQTGKVSGKAPYSAFKIILFIAVILAIIAGIVILVQRSKGN